MREKVDAVPGRNDAKTYCRVIVSGNYYPVKCSAQEIVQSPVLGMSRWFGNVAQV